MARKLTQWSAALDGPRVTTEPRRVGAAFRIVLLPLVVLLAASGTALADTTPADSTPGGHQVIERTVHAADGVIALEVGPESGPENGPVETIEATREHPFWARTSASALASSSAVRPGSGPRDGWVPAGELRPGDETFTSTGGWIRIHGNTLGGSWYGGNQAAIDRFTTWWGLPVYVVRGP